MLITKELAQQIVDNIMPIVKQNINIMNDQGVIIASGQANRVNTFHKGAMDAVEKNSVVEIYPHELDSYPGSLPGLNWPIVLSEHIVGVVGVTGHPDVVRDTARLVKMVTELILEREIIVEEFRSQKHLLEQFFARLLSDQAPQNYPLIKQQAGLMGFPLKLPRLAAVINVGPVLESAYSSYGVSDFVFARTQKTITQTVEESGLLDKTDRATFLDGRLVILKHFPAGADALVFHDWGMRIVGLFEPEDGDANLRIGFGSLAEGPLELYSSYSEALYALKAPPPGRKVTSIYDFEVMASYMVSEPQARKTCQAFRSLGAKITARIDDKYDLANTVRHVMDADLNLSAAAKSLFIHRNTLVFRLEKLKKLTGLQPSQFLSHAIICKMLFTL